MSDQRFPEGAEFTPADLRSAPRVTSEWKGFSVISLPDTLNFVANLLLLLPDVATCGQMFIILNS